MQHADKGKYWLMVIPQLRVQVIQMDPYTPLWPPAHRASLRGMSPSGAEPGPEGKEGQPACAKPLRRRQGGDFTSIILKSPFIPLCPPGQPPAQRASRLGERPLWVGDQRGIKTPVTEGIHFSIEMFPER